MNDWKKEDNKFKYQMLDRLRTDCEYFLGNGNRQEKHLWAGNINKQIEKNPLKIKVFIEYSETQYYKKNEVYSIEQMKSKYPLALAELNREKERLGLNNIFNKVNILFIIDDKETISLSSAVRLDIGDYKDFNSFMEKAFEKETYNFLQANKEKKSVEEPIQNLSEAQDEEEDEEEDTL